MADGGTIGGISTRAKNRKTKRGRTRSHVPRSKWQNGRKTWALPPVNYKKGPFTIEIGEYLFRLWGIRGDERDVVLLPEGTTVTWDDASAVLTGGLTWQTPDWATKLGLREGHKIRCEVSDDLGRTYAPLWTMRLDSPNSDLMQRAKTANLVSDLNRLAQSNDDFVFAKNKRRPKGWRGDEAIRFILDKYGYEVAALPAFTTYITKWHLTDVKPLDVIHSILLREKRMAGNAYAISMDWRERVSIRALARPTDLRVIGPQLLAATVSAAHDARFATALTVRSDIGAQVGSDSKGHRKVAFSKMAASMQSSAGVRLYGLIHRNVYSPDAQSVATLKHEGGLFLAAVAKFRRQVQVTMPGMPSVRRLDAFRVKLSEQGLDQIVYVAEAKHTADGGNGYTTDVTLGFQDPFRDDKTLTILNKLSDSASARGRVLPAQKQNGTKKTTKTQRARQRQLRGVTTNPGGSPRHHPGDVKRKKTTTGGPRSTRR